MRTTKLETNLKEQEISDLAAYVDKNYDETELINLLGISKNKFNSYVKILKNKKIIFQYI